MEMAKRRIQRHSGFAAGVDWSHLLVEGKGKPPRRPKEQQKKRTTRLNARLSV
jgi:hypothetical protein